VACGGLREKEASVAATSRGANNQKSIDSPSGDFPSGDFSSDAFYSTGARAECSGWGSF
jgi:hypothetical protein